MRHLIPNSVEWLADAAVPVLIDASIKGAVLLLLAGLVVRLLRKSSADARHSVWVMALGGMAMLPLLSAVLPGWQAVPDVIALRSMDHVAFKNGLPAEVEMPMQHIVPVAPTRNRVRDAVSETTARARQRPAALESPADATPMTASWLLDWRRDFGAIWILGTVVMLVRLLASRFVLHRVVKSASVPSESLGRLIDDVRRQLGVRRSPRVFVTSRRTMPMSWGLFRAFVLLPSEAATWEQSKIRTVLLHEFGHVKRRDTAIHVLLHVTCAAWWFHPLVWLAIRRIRIERELACDDLVLQSGVRASDYADDLTSILARLNSRVPSPAVGMASPSQLETRVMAIMNTSRSRTRVTGRTLSLLAVLTILATTTLAALEAAESDLPDNDNGRPYSDSSTGNPGKENPEKNETLDSRVKRLEALVEQLTKHQGKKDAAAKQRTYDFLRLPRFKMSDHDGLAIERYLGDLNKATFQHACVKCHRFNDDHGHSPSGSAYGPDLMFDTSDLANHIAKLEAAIIRLKAERDTAKAEQRLLERDGAGDDARQKLANRILKIEARIVQLTADRDTARLVQKTQTSEAAEGGAERKTDREPIGTPLDDWGKLEVESKDLKAVREQLKGIEVQLVSILAEAGKAESIDAYFNADPKLYRVTDLKTLQRRLKLVDTMFQAIDRAPVRSSLNDWVGEKEWLRLQQERSRENENQARQKGR